MFLKLEDYMLPCLSKKLLGIECMGCGLQRSLLFLLKGDFSKAFVMYPAIYSLIIMFLLIIINLKFNFKNGDKLVLGLFLVNIILIVGNYILKITH